VWSQPQWMGWVDSQIRQDIATVKNPLIDLEEVVQAVGPQVRLKTLKDINLGTILVST
jgi:hypothetical protein